MDYLKKFRVPVAGLKQGKHLFRFSIEKEFLEHFFFQDLSNILANLDLSLDKQPGMYHLVFEIKGNLKTLCDRCGDDLDFPFETNQEMFFKFGQSPGEESENIIVIPFDQPEIDLSQYIYEFITFAIPLKKIHSQGGCNKESLKKLNEIINTPEKKKTDPRWKELEKLKTFNFLPNGEKKKNNIQ